MMQMSSQRFLRVLALPVSKILFLLILSATAGFAETIYFTGLPVNTTFGTYNGFALATVNGTPNELLVCDDYNHTTYINSGPLTYVVSTLSATNPLQFARFLNPSQPSEAITRYEEAALLVDGLLHTGPTGHPDLTADYQYALWHLMTPTVVLPTLTSQTLLNTVANSVANPGSSNPDIYARLRIYTPVGPYVSNQEFLTLVDSPSVPTPEPSGLSFAAIGIALLLIGALPRWVRARRARAASCA